MVVLRDWQNFYMLTGTAAATLIGLLFVAVSIGANLPREQVRNSLRTFVNPTLIYYFQVLLISCLAVMPLQDAFIFSAALAILGSITLVLALKVGWRMRILHRSESNLDHWAWHFLLPFIASLLFIGTAVGFFLGQPLALAGLSLAILLCLGIGLHNTWVLMLWLALRREQPDGQKEHTDELFANVDAEQPTRARTVT